MKHWRLHLLLRAVPLALAGTLLAGLNTVSAADLTIGATLPSFSLKNVGGQTVKSDSFSSKPALVVVFADNHCTYCQAYQSRLNVLQNAYEPKGVQFVLINPDVTIESLDAVQVDAVKASYPFPYLIDESQSVAKAFGAVRMPEVFVFGPNEKLVYRGQIDDNAEEKMVRRNDLKAALEAVLKGTPEAIAHPVTTPFGCSIKWRP